MRSVRSQSYSCVTLCMNVSHLKIQKKNTRVLPSASLLKRERAKRCERVSAMRSRRRTCVGAGRSNIYVAPGMYRAHVRPLGGAHYFAIAEIIKRAAGVKKGGLRIQSFIKWIPGSGITHANRYKCSHTHSMALCWARISTARVWV